MRRPKRGRLIAANGRLSIARRYGTVPCRVVTATSSSSPSRCRQDAAAADDDSVVPRESASRVRAPRDVNDPPGTRPWRARTRWSAPPSWRRSWTGPAVARTARCATGLGAVRRSCCPREARATWRRRLPPLAWGSAAPPIAPTGPVDGLDACAPWSCAEGASLRGAGE